MPSTVVVDNKFIGGLKTEFTGLNFPDDSCTETFNCVFGRTGTVSRRLGIDYEANYNSSVISRTDKAVSTYYWKNVIGDGEISLVVVQVGTTLYFYKSSSATEASPTSANILSSTINLTTFLADGASSVDATVECQFADGNGYLFVFHKDIEPVYITYSADVLTGMPIVIKIRDFEGILESGIDDTFRPVTLSTSHQYNLQNQGWAPFAGATSWTASSITSNTTATGPHTWTIESGLTISAGQVVTCYFMLSGNYYTSTGIVTSYAGTTLILNITSTTVDHGAVSDVWSFVAAGSSTSGYIFDWHTAIGNYPANSDVWWLFKNSSDVFAPATTIANVTLNQGPAPKGFYILNAFNQNRTSISGVAGLTNQTSNGIRPSTGCFFQGRVWYTGVNYLGFNENIYFSQIIENITQFGKCYQTNDPTSEDRADLLASDGGVLKIQGTGEIFKLFTMVNGLLVFAERGIWFITGSTGIGFTANDFTVTKISNVPTLSATSFVNVQGYPQWCNEDGIYAVTVPAQGSVQTQGLTVQPLTYGTIASFYQTIPFLSKKYMRGQFDYLDYKVQWLYRDAEEANVTDRYTYSNILNFDTLTTAFYPWSIDNSPTSINSVLTFGNNHQLEYKFRYLCSTGTNLTFAEERDTNYVDWETPGVGVDYSSYFITGYRVYTKGNTRGQLPMVDVHSVGDINSECTLQSRWDYTTSGNTGRWSQLQTISFDAPDKAFQTKRRRVRGQGRAVQLKFSSTAGLPMSIIGWSTLVEATGKP